MREALSHTLRVCGWSLLAVVVLFGLLFLASGLKHYPIPTGLLTFVVLAVGLAFWRRRRPDPARLDA